MHYVILAEHTAESCPTANAKTRALMEDMGPQMGKMAEANGITIVSGPFASHEHISVIILETDRAEGLDAFITQSRLNQWNRVRVIPSRPIDKAMADAAEVEALF